MNDRLNKLSEKIEHLSRSKVILSPIEFKEIVDIFDYNNYFLISYRNNKTIIPSLSLCVFDRKLTIFNNLREIFNTFASIKTKDYIEHCCKLSGDNYPIDLIEKSRKINFNRCTIDDLEYFCTILYFELNYIPQYKTILIFTEESKLNTSPKFESDIEQMAKIYDTIKINSFNIVNDYLDERIIESKNIKKCFSSSVTETVNKFVLYIRKSYKIGSDYFNIKTLTIEHGSILFDQVKESTPNLSDLIKLGKPICSKVDNWNYCIVPFVNKYKSKEMRFCLFLYSLEYIHINIIRNLVHFIDYYFSEFIELQKRKLITSLNKRIADLKSSTHWNNKYIGGINYPNELREFSQYLCNEIVQISNAHSATVRIYDPFTKTLNLLAIKERKGIFSEPSYRDKIPLRIHNTSLNASVFLGTKRKKNVLVCESDEDELKKSDFKYIPNLAKSKRATLVARKDTKSELCYVVYFKNLPFGTFNLESSISNAFKGDLTFFRDIVNTLENYVSFILEINDMHVLAKRSKTYQNVHEIKNVLDETNFPLEYKKRILDYFSWMHINVTENYKKISELKIVLDEYINTYKNDIKYSQIKEITDDAEDHFSKCFKIIIKNDIDILEHKYDMLVIIYKNLLSNFKKWSNHLYDELNLTVDSQKIEFKLISSRIFDEKMFTKYFVTDYIRQDGDVSRKHSGLFIIGMLVRHLGGFSYVRNDFANSKGNIIVTIPIVEE